MYLIYRSDEKKTPKLYQLVDKPISFKWLKNKYFLGIKVAKSIEYMKPGQVARVNVDVTDLIVKGNKIKTYVIVKV